MAWKSLDDMQLDGKIVLTRVDINVPLDDGKVSDTTRIDRIVPTIKDILAAGGQPVLLAHFGRPKGKIVADMSLQQLVPTLSAAFATDVHFTTLADAKTVIKSGGVVLLENTRFDPREEANDPSLAAEYAALGDIYCNDAFSAAHRGHASTEALARALPSCAGRLMQEELKALETALGNPAHPVVAVVGGAKVSTKLELLRNLLPKVDTIVIGGGMANTFLAALGKPVGTSLCEHDLADTARQIMAEAVSQSTQLLLPKDVVVAEAFAANSPNRVVDANAVPDDMMILDAGPESVIEIKRALEDAKTLVWNGPLGAFEIEPFDAATNAAAGLAARLTQSGALLSVAGGGDTVAALNSADAADKFTYVSTAGGAFLEWMEGKTLPGVAALGG